MQLNSGGYFDFDTMRIVGPYTVEEDLARALRIPRAGCHYDVMWPVTLHSVAVARTIEAVTGNLDAAAAGLLHDAHEGIIGDIMTPVAWAIDYRKIDALKADVQAAIHWKLSISERFWPEHYAEYVVPADQAALYVERREWMKPEPMDWATPIPEHKWLLAMHRAVQELAYGPGRPDHEVFVEEYHRLIRDRKPRVAN